MRFIFPLILAALLFVEPLAANWGRGFGGAFGGAVAGRGFMGRIANKGSVGRRIYNPGKSRSITRPQWKARNSEVRARESIRSMQREAERNWRSRPGNALGKKYGLPHFHERHGYQTTLRQQYIRQRYYRTPDGVQYKKAPLASTKFKNARAEMEAIGKARTQMRGKSVPSTKGYHEEVVTSRNSFGRGYFTDSNTGTIKGTGSLNKAYVSFRFNSFTKQWDPWTAYPIR